MGLWKPSLKTLKQRYFGGEHTAVKGYRGGAAVISFIFFYFFCDLFSSFIVSLSIYLVASPPIFANIVFSTVAHIILAMDKNDRVLQKPDVDDWLAEIEAELGEISEEIGS